VKIIHPEYDFGLVRSQLAGNVAIDRERVEQGPGPVDGSREVDREAGVIDEGPERLGDNVVGNVGWTWMADKHTQRVEEPQVQCDAWARLHGSGGGCQISRNRRSAQRDSNLIP
jgi:hypothetical protein